MRKTTCNSAGCCFIISMDIITIIWYNIYVIKRSDNMKKHKLLILVVVIIGILSCSTVVLASDKDDVIVSLQIDNPVMEVNGVETEIDQGRGTMPVVTNGRTLVPIRAIIEAFGGEVGWDGTTGTVILTMDDDTIRLVINSNIAYLNDKAETLDVAPAVINDRTMLPIRFVAEGFNLGVAWDGSTRTVSVIRNSFDDEEYELLMSELPEYSGLAYAQINNNVPYFDDYEIVNGSFEYYSTLDELGRCDVCFASIASDLMPTEERESISTVKPTGWINASYDVVDGGYLYNRCHLIGFQLTGENANERNLITGTRYLNIEGMLPFENDIADYIEKTGNRVMYRVTPVFTEDNLVADGVLMEAYSVEDDGEGVSFCVFCYNVQPLVYIDYATGESRKSGSHTEDIADNPTEEVVTGIYATPTGKKYHFDKECGGKNSRPVTLDYAIDSGLTPCTKCAQ